MDNIYHPLPKWKALLILTPALGVGIILGLFAYFRAGTYALVCNSIMIAILVAISIGRFNTALFVFEDGIQYRDGGRVVEAKWNELTAIQEERWYRLFIIEKIFVLIPSRHDIPIPGITRFLYSISSPVRIQHSAFIPLSIFADNWRDSELGRQIKEHAPHLFQ